MYEAALTIDREIEDVKAQVRKELQTIRELLDTFGYRDSTPGWDTPFQLHRLRRALRVHYLALKIREAIPADDDTSQLTWELPASPRQ